MQQPPGPVTLAVVNDYELVVRGVFAMLAEHSDRVRVLELDSDVPVSQPVDVSLYDTFSMETLHGEDLSEILANTTYGRVVLYTWNHSRDVIEEALARGIRGIVSKSLGVEALLDAVMRVHNGEIVVNVGTVPPEEDEYAEGDWPGKKEGFTPRESEIVALIAQGLSNDEIARRLYLSINTVKTYIRTAYRRMDVTSRSQAVLWAMDHGFAQRRTRIHVAPASRVP